MATRSGPEVATGDPEPVFHGRPDHGYPWPWAVYRWLDGSTATYRDLGDPLNVDRLAHFVRALHACDTTAAPKAGAHNFFRGVPLGERDTATRDVIHHLGGQIDCHAATTVWEQAVNAAGWDRTPVWIHGDLLPANLLVSGDELTAVIDFGGLGAGDPACDVMAAWTCLNPATRPQFHAAVEIGLGVEVDAACWTRARGWALSFGLVALAYHQDTNSALAASARHAIDQTLGDPTR